MAVTAALSPCSFPQSSTGLLEVTSVLARSYRRMTISNNSSAAVGLAYASQVIDDQQGHGGQQFHVLLAVSIEGRFGDFLKQDVCLAVDHPIALADDGLPDGLGQMAFAGAGWTWKECIFAARDERGRRQIEDQAPIHLLVEVEIKVVEGHLRIAKLRDFQEGGI